MVSLIISPVYCDSGLNDSDHISDHISDHSRSYEGNVLSASDVGLLCWVDA
jgi:hypothetical protein